MLRAVTKWAKSKIKTEKKKGRDVHAADGKEHCFALFFRSAWLCIQKARASFNHGIYNCLLCVGGCRKEKPSSNES